VISSGVDDTAQVYSLRSAAKTREFSGERFRFPSIVVTKDGADAFTPAMDGAIYFWDIATGKNLRRFAGTGTSLATVAISHDAGLVAAAGQGTSIFVWNFLGSGLNPRKFKVDAPVLQVVFLPSDAGFNAILGDGRVCRWNLQHSGVERCAEATTEPVSQATVSLDGRRALIASRYGTLILWDLQNASVIRTLERADSDIVSLALSPGGNLALSGGADRTVRLWNVNSREQIASYKVAGDYVSAVAFSPDEALGVFGTSDGSVALWRLE
jgi:WD40 repeat protein